MEFLGAFFGVTNAPINVLITVPHAKCRVNNPHHSCDTHAVLLAEKLAMGFPQHKLVIGDINRDKCDLNRASCTVSPNKSAMHSLITSDKYTILCDAHSYPHKVPADNTIFAKDSSAFQHNAWDADLFFIVNEHDYRSQEFFAEVMCDVRQSTNNTFDLRCLKGTNKLDLIRRGYQAGLYSVLIEAGEHLTVEQVAQLASAITSAITNCKKRRVYG